LIYLQLNSFETNSNLGFVKTCIKLARYLSKDWGGLILTRCIQSTYM